MNLQQLEYFVKIAETKNFTLASEQMAVSQPALSKSISKLEEELRATLFERNNKSVKLTSQGEIFLNHAIIALTQIEKGKLEIKNMSNQEKNRLSIASTYCIGTYFIPSVIGKFLTLYPETEFKFNNTDTESILNDLNTGKIELGFYENFDELYKFKDIESVEVKREQYVLITHVGHKLAKKDMVSLRDLKDESFVVYCEAGKDKKLSYSEFLKYTPKISIKPSEINMLGGLVASGAGISIVPNTPMINTNAVSILNIEEDLGYKITNMGWLKNAKLSETAQRFKEYILELQNK